MGFLKRTLLVLLFATAPVHAAEPLQLYEQKIKAGLLYNFLKYTTWPANTVAKWNGTLRICLMGRDTFNEYLYPLEGRTAQQYVIAITHISTAAEADNCGVVVINSNHAGDLPQILRGLRDKQVLTVSDIDRFAARGGMVEFTKSNQHVSLFINKQATDSSGLVIQGRLLKLAHLVSSGE